MSTESMVTQAAGGRNEGHGHVLTRPDGAKARCGGPAICRECARDLAVLQQVVSHRTAAQPEREAVLRKVRADIFDALRRHDVSEQCFAEVAMITHAALTTPAPAVSREEIAAVLEHVRNGGPHEWGYRDITDGTFIADDWPFEAAAILSRIQGMTQDKGVPASVPSAIDIPNPVRWYFQYDLEAEWWHRGGKTREEAIDKGIAEYDGEPFWIAECKSMVPRFDIFDGDDICDRLGEDEETWWEDGWTGEPDRKAKAELERRLEATFKQWFAEFATLDGACLDQLRSEQITAQAIEARRAETQSGSVHESAVRQDAPETNTSPGDSE